MRVLIACERFGAVRDAFLARGHDAWSLDIAPDATGSARHIQDDVRLHLREGWDLMIAHPDCTYLTSAAEWAYGPGPYHQKVKPGTLTGQARRDARQSAIELVREIMAAPIPRIAVENPVGVLSSRIRKPDQIIQPHQFGADASKATCLWLQGLPLLVATYRIAPRMIDGRPRWGNQTDSGQNRLSPGAGRAMERARTYPGIASAMADQWGRE
jgi:hypothetical protein